MIKLLQKRFFFSFLLLCGVFLSANATHNRAGEIIYRQIGDLTIEATIITYTKTSSADADRDSLTLHWGDGTSQAVQRSNGNGMELDNDIKLNYYIAQHTYPARATYTMWFRDQNRVANILNVNAPNSIEIPFFVQTTFTFLNSQFQGSNSSVELLAAPIDFACVGQKFTHNPNAFDVDGDSIAYELVIPGEAPDTDVPKYKFPDEIVMGPFNQISLDPVTGNFVWESPQLVGEYNIAIRILEYREGVLIGSVIRDMQIFVSDCDNKPPTIEGIDEICVIAGEKISIPLRIDDEDEGQLVSVTATGGPFEQEFSMATLDVDDEFMEPPFTVNFEWQTVCEHIEDTYYQVVVRAADDFPVSLAELKTIRIKVVGPPPENLETETSAEEIKLTWDSPYECEDAANMYFQGFSVWRKLKSNQFPLDTCDPGLEGKGYKKIEFITKEKEGDKYVYYDRGILKGNTYCYRVLAEFAKISPAGFPFNPVASLPSNEACGILVRDIPLITKVSVVETDQNSGSIDVHWIKPKIPDLDTTLFPGPYRYQLRRGVGFNPSSFEEVSGANFTTPFFGSDVDSTFLDQNINTVPQPYTYIVDFYTGQSNEVYGSSSEASSVFLALNSNDKRVDLIWGEAVPWENFEYTIYRRSINTGELDSIGVVENNSYRDEGLENGQEYCYVVRSTGTYGITGIIDPLYNFSQEACDIPKDSLPPCVPILSVSNLCDDTDLVGPNGEFFNLVKWNEPEIGCLSEDDVESFNIYFSDDSLDFEVIANVSADEEFEYMDFLDNTVTGCYAVTAIDSSGNESELSEVICSANCPLYELPNVFTPNGDNANDLFVPRSNRFVTSVDFKVFNRWGALVFQTNDPELNWNGTNLRGEELVDGVYYYDCIVQESMIGTNPAQAIGKLSGSIHLIRSR